MAGDLLETLQRVSSKTDFLMQRYNKVLQEKQSAETRVNELENTVLRLNDKIKQLETRIEYLTVMTTVIPSRDDVEASRAKLAKLVRDIDKCISELSE
jgi:predicted  nucleic acid-binding Zn-ribbon protein